MHMHICIVNHILTHTHTPARTFTHTYTHTHLYYTQVLNLLSVLVYYLYVGQLLISTNSLGTFLLIY